MIINVYGKPKVYLFLSITCKKAYIHDTRNVSLVIAYFHYVKQLKKYI